MKITVTWKTVPSTGMTDIDLADLGCKTKKKWNNLSTEEQRERINEALMKRKPSNLSIIGYSLMGFILAVIIFAGVLLIFLHSSSMQTNF